MDTNLPKKIREALAAFVSRLKAVYGEDLVSVTLFGSAASGEFAEKYSNVNVLVVLRDTGLPALSKICPDLSLGKFSTINPVFFTESYIISSLDVFPIEFLDMQENNRVLYGKDVLKGLVVGTKNLRFQCEQELKSKLIQIKKHYLLTKDSASLEKMLFKSFTSVLHILRNILRLKGKQPPYRKDEIVDEAEKELGLSLAIFDEMLWARSKDMKLSRKETEALLTGFVNELEALAEAVDRL